ncbi:YceI family protein [Dyadobacter sp. LHD-138]|uniref:YceI family protein n=1 Tax=Dyadobacter sp. LHD-138 TaxID=3071413 RepID=UPI0027E0F197|nr:YceI family protein [Dyadobacter sp. LHD-138]MDQ6479081.1 YceI family protein [Dyadobacter sp. LHD-138]
MKKLSLLFIIISLTLSAYAAMRLTDWQIVDEIYSITFKTKGAKGSFKGLKGTIHFEEANLVQSSFNVAVEVNTINTGIGLKNKHALAEDFFDAAHYPHIHFSSSTISKSDSGFVVSGPLTIKGITKEITFPFSFERAAHNGVFKGTFEINRNEYNLNKKGIGEIVKIDLHVPVKNDTIQ